MGVAGAMLQENHKALSMCDVYALEIDACTCGFFFFGLNVLTKAK